MSLISLLQRSSSSTSILFFPHYFPRLFFSSSSLSFQKDDPQSLASLHTQNPTSQNHHQWTQNQIISAHVQKREHLFSLLQCCSHYTHLLQIHTQFIRTQFIQYPRLSLKFLSRAAKICPQNVVYFNRIFSQISMPNLSHYNTMIRAFSCSEFPVDGLKLYVMMRQMGVLSDYLTMSFCLDCCAKINGLFDLMQFHGRILADGFEKDCVLMTSLMQLYSNCGRYDDACQVFDDMPHRDTVAYNALISCFLNNKRTRDALAVFESMRTLKTGCKPDDVTCLLLLQACGDLGALDFSKIVRDYIERYGYSKSIKINNSLITMYSKCGSLDEAYQIFERMPNKNLVSWSSMISGFGMNGYGKCAVEMFWDMLKLGISPDDKAITAVLYACSYRGLLKEGVLLFEMIQEFGIIPKIHHYGCVVDILGRVGSLDQAYDLIMSMEDKPDAKIWRTLLRACRMHQNFGLAERVIDHIVELKAQEVGDYVLLLNTYSSSGNWDKIRKLKEFMEERGIVTPHECSTIELKGIVHEFNAHNVSHPRKGETYEMLSEILQQLKIAGYVPDVSSELHDLNMIEKGTTISYHSEKLAIAFGVLCTLPGTTIRVANSVQICGDCHNFAKALSAVYNRKVIIRDPNRIHLFREGTCSCDNYW